MTTKERYWEKINAGLCTFCGTAPARPGRVMCQDCAGWKAAWKRAHRVPSERRRGAPTRYEYTVISAQGERVFAGDAAQLAGFLGCSRQTIWKNNGGKLVRKAGWRLERRNIRGDADESGAESV